MKKLIALAVFLVVIGAIVFAFIRGQKERASEAERERPVKAASRVSVQDNEPIISIDAATQQKSGITAVALPSTMHQSQQPRAGARNARLGGRAQRLSHGEG